MKEWDPKDAMEVIESIIKDGIPEEKLSDLECEALAAKIVAALEGQSNE